MCQEECRKSDRSQNAAGQSEWGFPGNVSGLGEEGREGLGSSFSERLGCQWIRVHGVQVGLGKRQHGDRTRE